MILRFMTVLLEPVDEVTHLVHLHSFYTLSFEVYYKSCDLCQMVLFYQLASYKMTSQVHCTILDGGYLVASLSLLYITIIILYALCQGVIGSLPWVELLRVRSLHAQSYNELDQTLIHSDMLVKPHISFMVARHEEFNASVNLLMLSEVSGLHYIQDHRLRELLNPWLGDYARLLPSRSHQIPMRRDHHIFLPISEVKVFILQSWDMS